MIVYTIQHERNPARAERWAVYEEIPQSMPPRLVVTYDTREAAVAFVNDVGTDR